MMRLEVFRLATEMLQYLDTDGLDETVLNIGEIKTNLEGQISDLEESIEEEMQDLPYARPDGLYPDMTVGAVIGADETAQWAQRESTGSGAAIVRSVQGAAVGWNQYAKLVNRTATSKGITYTAQDGKATFSAPNGAEGQETFYTDINNRFPLVAGHKYIAYGTSPDGNVRLAHANMGVLPYNQVFTGTGTPNNQISFSVQSTFTGTYECYPMVFDLTQMFGAGNEPQSVAEFEQMYSLTYYPYSAPTLKPVRIAGIRSTDANGDALYGVEWTAQTLRAAGSVADVLYSDHVDVRVGVVDLGTLAWVSAPRASGSTPPDVYYYTRGLIGLKASGNTNLRCALYENTEISPTSMPDKSIKGNASNGNVSVVDSSYSTVDEFVAAMSGVLLFYELSTPTTTPISPALPMTYRVEQGGIESIIVPDGEISAAPVLTVAEPVNAGDEFARIWEAIQSLGYTRNAAQLSRQISLTDVGSVDEVQKDTTDVVEKEAAEVAEIDTVKEVQE